VGVYFFINIMILGKLKLYNLIYFAVLFVITHALLTYRSLVEILLNFIVLSRMVNFMGLSLWHIYQFPDLELPVSNVIKFWRR